MWRFLKNGGTPAVGRGGAAGGGSGGFGLEPTVVVRAFLAFFFAAGLGSGFAAGIVACDGFAFFMPDLDDAPEAFCDLRQALRCLRSSSLLVPIVPQNGHVHVASALASSPCSTMKRRCSSQSGGPISAARWS